MMQLNQAPLVAPRSFRERGDGMRMFLFLWLAVIFCRWETLALAPRTQIVSTTLPAQNSLNSMAIDRFTISAGTDVQTSSGTNRSNFGLREAGPNQLLGDSDDFVYVLSATVTGTNVAFSFSNSPLQPGQFRFETKIGLQDSTGAPIQPFTREFVIAQPVGGRIETTSNDRLEEATVLPVAESPVGTRFFTAIGAGSVGTATDVDFWRFDAEAGDRITVRVVADATTTQPQIQLRNAADAMVTSANGQSGAVVLQDFNVPAPGTYYLRVTANRLGSYTLRLDQSRGPQLETEANDTVATADAAGLKILSGGYSVALAGSIERGEVVDYFSLGHLTAGNNLTVNALMPAGSTLARDKMALKLFRAGVTQAITLSQNGVLNFNLTVDGIHYLSIEATEGAGFRAQYLLNVGIADTVAPRLVSVSLPDENGSTRAMVNDFLMQFSEDMDPALLRNSTNYELRNSGRDGQFNTTDDELYQVVNETYTGGLNPKFTLPDGPLQAGNYVLRVSTGINDRAGNPLDATFVRRFRVDADPEYPMEGRNNDSLGGAAPLGILSGKSDLSFTPVRTLPAGSQTYHIDTSDFNRDGNADLVAANYGGGNVTVLLGQGNGNFAAGKEFAVDGSPLFVRAIDLNQDQRPDIATANPGGNSITVLLGTSDGAFNKLKLELTGSPSSFGVGDLNGDGRLDLVTAHGSVLAVLLATAPGTFSPPLTSEFGFRAPYGVAVADVTGDNVLDVLVANVNTDQISVLIGKGNGTFDAMETIATGDQPRHLGIADLDADGDRDLVVLCAGDNKVEVFRNNGRGVFEQRRAFEAQGSDGYDLRLADVTGDGQLDVLVAAYGQSRLSVLRNFGNGELAGAAHFAISGNPISAVAGDFDKDGVTDIATANYSGRSVTLFRGNSLKQAPADSALPELRLLSGRGSLTSIEDVDYWSFSLKAGESISVASETGVNSSSLLFQLLRSDGQRAETFYSAGNGNGQMRPYTVSTDGTYFIAVSYNNQYFGEYRWRAIISGAGTQHETENNDSAGQANTPVFAPSGPDRTAGIAGFMTLDDLSTGDFFNLGTVASGTPINVVAKQPSISAFMPTIELLKGSVVVASAVEGKELAYIVPAGGDAVLQLRIKGTNGAKTLGVSAIYLAELKLGGEATQPHIVDVDLPADGTTSSRLINRFRVQFDEEMDSRFNGIGRRFVFRGDTAFSATPSAMSWPAADAYARMLGGALVTIDDATENDWLRQQFARSGIFWTGLSDSETEEVLKWSTGTTLGFTKWGANEPSNSADRDYAAVTYWGQWFLAGNANYIGIVEVPSRDSDLDGVPDVADPYPQDPLNGIDLRNAGADGVFETGDDRVYPVTSVGYTTGLSAEFLLETGPLGAGSYKLRITRSLTDKAGNGIAEEYVRRFAVAGVERFVLERPDGDSRAGATVLAASEAKTSDGSITSAFQSTVGANPYSIASADFNEDGRGDLVTADYGGNSVSLSLGRGDGTFEPALAFGVDRNPIHLVIGDFNRDGHKDVATANVSGPSVSVLQGDGKGGFGPVLNFPAGGSPQWVTAGDLDGDGFDDIVSANQSAGNGTIVFGAAAAERRSITMALGNGPRAVAIGDFNNDGRVDILSANQSENSLSFLAGNGAGTFEPARKTSTVPGGQAMRVADLNGDGKLDCVVMNTTGATMDIYLGDGQGMFQRGKTYAYGSGGNYDFVLSDLNADAKLDIVLANYSQNQIGLLLGKGQGEFGGVVQSQASGNPISVVTGDFNRDGLMDIAAANYSGSTITVHLGNTSKILTQDSAVSAFRSGSGRGALLNREDVDYWSFSGIAGQSVSIVTEAPEAQSAASLYYRLQRPNGEMVTSFYSAGSGAGQSLPVLLPVSGSYLVLVSYNNEFIGEYRFRVTLIDPPHATESEANNTIGAADALAFVARLGENRSSVAGVLTAGDPGDFFGLGAVPAGSPIEIAVRPGAGNGIIPKLELFRGNTLVLAAADGALALAHTVPLTGDGNYTLKISGKDGSAPLGLFADYLLEATIRKEQVPPAILSVDLPEEGSISSGVIDHFGITMSEDLSLALNGLGRSFLKHGRNYYTSTSRALTWPAAEAEAQSMGGHLVTVNDRAESDWLTVNFTAPFWIGFNDATEEGNFAWASGDPVTFTQWNSGEPNNSGDEDYAHTYASGTWNDISAGTLYVGIIEINGGTGLDSDGDGIADAIDPFPGDGLNAFDLREAGFDGVFGTVDDNRFVVAPAAYTGGLSLAFNIVGSPLPPGKYRFTVTRSVTDLAGNALTAPFVREFRVAPVPPFVLEDGSNNGLLDATSLSTIAGAANGSFSIGKSMNTIGRPSAIASGDFNGDGMLDLAVAYYDRGSVGIFLGRANVEWEVSTELTAGTNPYYVLVGDFNRDGKLDLAVANYGAASVTLFLGLGDGAFGAGKTFKTGNNPLTLAAGDLDGDGYPEIVSGNTSGDNVTVINGGRTWITGTTQNFAAGDGARGVAVGDVNGDGFLDVVVACAGEDKLALLFGNGTGGLDLPRKIDAGNDPRFVEVDDLDGDGRLDWVVLNNGSGSLDIFGGDGKGGYAGRLSIQVAPNDAYQMILRDLNGDSRKDVLIVGYNPSSITLLINQGGGVFARPVAHAFAGNPLSAAPGDYDRDGILDIVTGNYGQGSLTFFGGSRNQGLQRSAVLGVELGGGRGRLAEQDNVDFFVFSGKAGQRVNLVFETLGGPSQSGLYFRLYRPGGVEIRAEVGNPNGYGNLGPITLPVDGNYYVGVAPYYNYFGEYRFRVLLADDEADVESEPNQSIPGNGLRFVAKGPIRVAEMIGTASGGGDVDFFGLGNLEPGNRVTLNVLREDQSRFPLSLALVGTDGRELVNPIVQGNSISFIVPTGIREPLFARINAFSFVPGLFQSDADRYSVYFDGDKEYAMIEDSATLRPANVTIEGWFSFATASGTQMLISKPLGTAGLNSYALWYDGNYLNGVIGDTGGFATTVRYQWRPEVGKWYHLAYVFDDLANTHSLLIGGDVVATVAANRSIGYDSHALLLGADSENENPAYFFRGNMDEVRVWGLARTPNEIRATHNLRLTGQEAGLRGYWNFDEGRGSEISDSTGKSGTGRFAKSPDWVPAVASFNPGSNLAQYKLQAEIEDVTGPVITGTSLVGENGVETRLISRIQLTFNEGVSPDFVGFNRSLFNRNGHAYLLTPDGMSWSDAQELALSMGGYLTVINESTENAWLRETFGFAGNFWIGLSDRVQEGQLVWEAGQVSQFTSWAPGEPRDSGDEDFVAMNANGQWSDVRLFSSYRAVIEFQGSDSDGDGLPDSVDPMRQSALNFFDLREAGRDGSFDTADDHVYLLAPSDYPGGLTIDFTVLDGPLPPGKYRFSATGLLKDQSGNTLASPLIRHFSVVPLPDFLTEPHANDGFANAMSLSGTTGGSLLGNHVLGEEVSTGRNPYHFGTGDLNGDGLIDLAVPNYGAATIQVLSGAVGGGFKMGISYATVSGPIDIEVRDLNKDQKLDLAVISYNSGKLSIFLGAGDGTFGLPVVYDTGANPRRVSSGDFDGDKSVDVAVVNYNGRSVSVYFGNGAGGLAGPTNLTSTAYPRGLSVADLNGDGRDDIFFVTESPGQRAVALGKTDRTFDVRAPVELPGDGRVVVLDQLDGQGGLDVAVATSNGRAVVLTGDGAGNFTQVQNVPTGVTDVYDLLVADLDRDGFKDVAIAAYGNNRVSILQQVEGFNFSAPLVYSVPGGPLSLAAGDFDKNGQTDLLVSLYGNDSLRFFHGRGEDSLREDPAIPELRVGGGRGTLTTKSDVDHWSFHAHAGDAIQVAVQSDSAIGTLYGTLYGPNYETLNSFTAGPGRLADSGMRIAPASGSYFVSLESNVEWTGEYALRATVVEPSATMEAEPNNSIATGSALAFETDGNASVASAVGYISGPNELDYFSLGNLIAGSTAYINVRLASGENPLIPVIAVYDSANGYMAEVEGGQAFDNVAEIRIQRSGVYYALVRGGGTSSGLMAQYALEARIVPTGSISFPNLQVASVTLPQVTQVLSGRAMNVRYFVRNSGAIGTPVANWLDRVSLSANEFIGDGDDIVLGNFPHAGVLAPGGIYEGNVNVTVPDGLQGNYFVIVGTDSGQQVSEFLFEGDNARASDSKIAVGLPPYADLIVEELKATVGDSGPVQIMWRTTNRGNGDAGKTFKERVLVRNLGTGAIVSGPVEQDKTQAFPVGASIPGEYSMARPSSGRYEVTVMTDSANDIFEFGSNGHLSAELNSFSTTFSLLLVNRAPSIAQVSDQVMPEDGTLNVPLSVDDVETGAASVFLTVSAANPLLIPPVLISVAGTGTNRTIVIRPGANLSGSTVITVTASDGVLSTKMAFGLRVNPVNDAPVISRISAVEFEEDESSGVVPFTISDVETDAGSLNLTAVSSSDPGLVPLSNIGFVGSGGTRGLILKSAANKFGQTLITVQVSDGQQSATASFVATVRPVNDAPTISEIRDVATRPSVPVGAIEFKVGDVESSLASLVVTVDSSNKGLVPPESIQLGGAGEVRTLTIISALGEKGATRITVTLSDPQGKSSATTFDLVVSDDTLLITSQPESTAVAEGSRAEFSIKAIGSGPLKYQWFANGVAVGTNTNTLVIASSRFSDAGSYFAEVTDQAGTTVRSHETRLRVLKGIVIEAGPQAKTAVVGANVAFSVKASGAEPLSYQWFFDGSIIPGATSPTLLLPAVKPANSGNYFVQVSNDFDQDQSGPAVLRVDEPLRFIQQPEDQIVKETESFILSAEALGATAYQWYFRGVPMTGETSASLPRSATRAESGEYRVEAKNAGGSIFSRVVRVIVVAPPVITKEPLGQSVAVGRSTKLGLIVSGTEPLEFEWFRNGVSIRKTLEPVLELLNVSVLDAGSYTVRVSNIAGEDISQAALITVIEGVQISSQPETQVRAVGDTVTFAVSASGTGLNFRWSYRGVPIPGATGATYTIPNAQITDSGSYNVEISNAAGAVRSVDASLRVLAPPVITRQPQSQNALLGGGARFAVGVSGSDPLTIQWTLNGVEIQNASTPILILNNLQSAQEGDYRVQVRNGAGAIISDAATLRVYRGVQVTRQPSGGTIRAGTDTNLSVIATGSEPLDYQWQRNGFNIPGATAATYAAREPGSYSVRVSNPAGSLMSDVVVVRVVQPVTFRLQPVALSVKGGESTVFKVIADGSGVLTYQWQREGQDIPGATSDTLFVREARGAAAGVYRVLVSNEIGSAMSQEARLTIIDAPVILSGPVSQFLSIGANLALSVSAEGAPPLSYQWKLNGVSIPGATAATFSLNNLQPTNIGNYSVSVANPGGVVSSSVAAITAQIPTLALADNRANAPLSILPVAVFRGDSTGATREANEPDHAPNQPASASVWFRWTAPFSGVVTFTTAGSGFDTILAAYTLNAQSQLEQQGSNEDGGPFKTSSIQINAIQGTTYFIAIDGYKGATGNVVISWLAEQKQPSLPRITRQPVGFTQLIGRNAQFSVEATGADANGLSYQWFYFNQPLVGETRATLNLISVHPTMVGRYSVLVGNAGNPLFSVLSEPAQLQINLIETQREGPEVNTGDKPNRGNTALLPQSIGSRSIRILQSVARGFTGSQIFSTIGLVRDESEPDHCNASGGASAWSLYEAPANGSLLVTTDGSFFDTVVAIYSGSGDDFESMVLLGCDDNGGTDGLDSRIVVPVTAGQIYFIVVDGVNGASGIAQLNYTLTQPPVVTQTSVQGNQALGVSSVTQGANITLQVIATNLSQAAQTYQWRVNGQSVAGQTNATFAINNFALGNVGDYNVTVGNFAGQTQSDTLSLSILSPVVITTALSNRTVAAGGSVVFTVAADGTGPLTYEWRLGGALIQGANTASLALNNVQATGTYQVRVSNAANSVTSEAVLTVLQPVSITLQPVGVAVNLGGTANLTAGATGSPAIGYQWRFNGVNLDGATSSALTLQNVIAQNGGNYSVLVSNSVSSVVSADAAVSIVAPVAIVQQPRDQTLSGTTTTQFEVITSGSEPIGYQWRFNGSAIGGATSRVLVLTNLTPLNAGNYSVVVTNAANSITSSNALLTLTAPPTISQQPQSRSGAIGASATFTVTAAGSGTLNYQWRFNGVHIPGQNGATLVLNSLALLHAGEYSVAIDNAVGSVVSAAAVLTVNSPVTIIQQPASVTALEGSAVGFNVLATGTSPMEFQWLKNESPIVGATNDTLNFASVTNIDAASYRVRVSNPGSTNSSNPATLTVQAVPQIVGQPQGIIVASGSPALFVVTATGSAPLAYQWRFNGAPMALETNASLQISAAGFAQEGDYTVAISNDAGNVASAIAMLSIDRGDQIVLAATIQNNEIVLILTGPAGRQCDIEASPNFTTWTVAGTVTLSSGQAEFRQGTSSPAFRFYRAVLKP